MLIVILMRQMQGKGFHMSSRKWMWPSKGIKERELTSSLNHNRNKIQNRKRPCDQGIKLCKTQMWRIMTRKMTKEKNGEKLVHNQLSNR